MVSFKTSLVLLALNGLLFSSCYEMDEAPDAIAEPEVSASTIDNLLSGNARFVAMHPDHPHENQQRLIEISTAQHPVAAVICCSDSRVPPELIFDQGLGDLFVVRTAGNLMGGLEIGSIEYAVEHLGVKQIIVMGHQQCGAIKAYVAGGEAPGHIHDIVDSIKAEQEIRQLPVNDQQLLDHCIQANIQHGVRQLKQQSALIAEKMQTGTVTIS